MTARPIGRAGKAGPAMPDEIDSRYRVEGLLGRGGMAAVYRVVDRATGDAMALKRLVVPDKAGHAKAARELFEREFHTLSELAHPAIVAAYDYGEYEGLPYYTMELLGGGDLYERAPCAWAQACALLRDICSALSLIHSRRYVYRDLSPRNVRCDQHGMAKLIDLGALAQMGTAPPAVCTPAVAAPEVVRLQPLDGRADLFALGATLFHALTGKHAYPARNFSHLEKLWQWTPKAPSAYVDGIPEALDRLVLELLQLDPHLRPANAAEVSQRLSALAGLPVDATNLASQAYLTTPSLVGRDQELALVRKRLKRAQRGRGSSQLVSGAPGVGRSRLVDAFVLEAKMVGMPALRVGAADAPQTAYGVAHAVAHQWSQVDLEGLLEHAEPDWDVLAAVLPALRELRPDRAVPELASDRIRVEGMPAIIRWWERATATQAMLLAVDDVDRLDVDSQALLALLAYGIDEGALVLLTSMTEHAEVGNDALHLLVGSSRRVALARLNIDDERTLLRSVFGDVPNLHTLVTRLHGLAEGNPKDLMQLCQHLLDAKMVRCDAGSWVIPEVIDDGSLPASMAQALAETVADLDGDGRCLAWAMACFADQVFNLDECGELLPGIGRPRLLSVLEDLLRTGVIRQRGHAYAIAGAAWQAALASAVDDAAVLRQRAGLGSVFEMRGDGIRAARCFFAAARESHGLDVLLAHAIRSSAVTNQDMHAFLRLLMSAPEDWVEVYHQAMALCEKHGRSRRDRFAIRTRMLGMASPSSSRTGDQLVLQMDSLAQACGLDIYATMDPQLPAQQRMMMALGEAAKREAAAPENEQLFPPQEALASISRSMVTAIGNIGNTLDVAQWERIPSIQPLSFLAPALALIARLQEGFDARLRGHFEVARDIYIEMLELLESPDVQLDLTYRRSLRSGLSVVLGILEAGLGLPTYTSHLALIESDLLHDASGLSIRAIALLWQGDLRGADELEREREVRRVENPHPPAFQALTLLWKMQAHAAARDLTRSRQDLEAITRVAAEVPTWQPALDWALGEYERVRGDHTAALAHLDAALDAMPEGAHQVWAAAAGAKVTALHEAGRFDEARQDGLRLLAVAEDKHLGVQAACIRMPLALATARLGDFDTARELARRCTADFEALGVTGLNLGLAYETEARVVALAGDRAAFETVSELCKAEFTRHKNRALAAKYQRLMREHGGVGVSGPGAGMAGDVTSMTTSLTELRSIFAGCAGSTARLDRGLWLLMKATEAQAAALFSLVDGEVELRASVGDMAVDDPLEGAVADLLEKALGDEITQTQGAASSPVGPLSSHNDGAGYHHPVLLSHGVDGSLAITGYVVLRSAATYLDVAPEMASALSRALSEQGDLLSHIVGD